MASKLVLTNDAFPLEAIKLASFIPNISSPHQDALNPPEIVEGQDFLVRNQDNFQGLISSSSQPKVHAHLTKLLSASYGGLDGSSSQLASQEAKIYELVQPKVLFKKLCAVQTTREWLQSGIEDGQKTYFITGLRTFRDAVRTEHKKSGVELSGNVQVPLGSVIAPGVEVILGDALNVGAGVGQKSVKETQKSYRNPGEQIYAICYRRVVFKWFQRKDVDKAFLDPENRWKIVSDDRADDEPAPEDEIVEADLEDIATEGEAAGTFAEYDDEKYILL